MTKEMMIAKMFKLCEGYYSQKHEITKCQVILKAFLTIYNPTKHVTLHRNQIPAAPTSAFSANVF